MVVIRIVLSEADQRVFLGVPQALGVIEPVWRALITAQQVDSKRNPFLRHAEIVSFVAYDSDRPLGRVSAYVDSRRGKDLGCFGLFECMDDVAVAGALLDAAYEWLWRRGCRTMRGPLDPIGFVMGGATVEGCDAEPTVATPATPAYYARLLEEAGFLPAVELLVWRYGQSPVPRQVQQISKAVAQHSGLVLRSLCASNFEHDLDDLTNVYNAAWADNWHYRAVDKDDMRWLLQEGAWLDFDLSFAAYVDGVPAAIAIACPNYDEFCVSNSMRSREWLAKLTTHAGTAPWVGKARMKFGGRPQVWRQLLFGVDPRFRGSIVGGLGIHLYNTVRQRARALGYEFGETGWTTSEAHVLNSGLKVLGADKTKVLQVYERPILA